MATHMAVASLWFSVPNFNIKVQTILSKSYYSHEHISPLIDIFVLCDFEALRRCDGIRTGRHTILVSSITTATGSGQCTMIYLLIFNKFEFCKFERLKRCHMGSLIYLQLASPSRPWYLSQTQINFRPFFITLSLIYQYNSVKLE